jgi:cell division protein FtsW (lipid II flippase)
MPARFAGGILIGIGAAGYVIGPTVLSFASDPGADALAYPIAAVWVALSAPLFSRALVPAAALFWVLFVIVALFGAIAGLRLSVLEQTSAYGSLMDRHLIVLTGIGLVAAGILCLSEAGGWALGRSLLLPRGTGWFGRIGLITLGLSYAVFTASGSETGFMGFFQPSEMAKSLLCFVVAFTLSRDIARRAMLAARDGGGDIISPVIAIFMTIAILATSLLNYDMSPIIVSFLSLILAFAAGAALHFNELRTSAGERRRKGLPLPTQPKQIGQLAGDQVGPAIRRRLVGVFSRWPTLLIVGVIIPGSIFLIGWLAGLGIFGENKPFVGLSEVLRETLMTPWLRVQSWWDMRLVGSEGIIDFPQTGDQLRLGRLAILEAHCGALDWFCPTGVPEVRGPLANERLLAVPAIQDDFAGISLIHTFGVDGAILYGAAQIALIATALTLGFQALNTRHAFRIGAWLTGITVIGLTAVVAAQILLAWGNVLGLLPIMGQPMTFVSFGASHHLGVALPFAAATIVCAQTVSLRRPNDVLSGLTLYRRRRIS